MNPISPSPWYKVPAAWLVFAIPGVAIVSGIAMITISVINRDSLVVDDYYKQGLGINQTLQRQEHAADLALSGDLEVNSDVNSILVSIRGNNNFIPPSSLTLGLYHSTNDSSDQILQMQQVTPGVYTVSLPPLPVGRWNVVVEEQDWRLSGSMFSPASNASVALNPG